MTSLTSRPTAQTRLTLPKPQYLLIDMASFSRIHELSGLPFALFLYQTDVKSFLIPARYWQNISGTRWTEYQVGPRFGLGVTAVIMYALPPIQTVVLQVIYVIKSIILTELSLPMHTQALCAYNILIRQKKVKMCLFQFSVSISVNLSGSSVSWKTNEDVILLFFVQNRLKESR
jgi:hypothetical protein